MLLSREALTCAQYCFRLCFVCYPQDYLQGKLPVFNLLTPQWRQVTPMKVKLGVEWGTVPPETANFLNFGNMLPYKGISVERFIQNFQGFAA